MNKSVFSLLACLVIGMLYGTQTASAQNYDKIDPLAHRHEVKLNVAKAVISLRPEVEYEYILRPDMGLGGRVCVALGENSRTKEMMGNFQVMPFFRWYFTANGESARSVARGFFAEVNTAITSYSHHTKYYESALDESYLTKDPDSSSFVALGLGISVGWKYVSRGGWTCDLGIGVGRNLGTKGEGFGSFYTVSGITIGKRF